MKSLVTLTAVALVATCATASAGTLEYNPYVGFEIGYMKTHSQKAEINTDNFNLKIDSLFQDEQYTGTLLIGARFSEHFGIEAFLQRGREEESSVNLAKHLPGGIIPDLPITYKVKATSQLNYAWGLDLNGYYPVSEKIELVGTVGAGLYNFTHGLKASVLGTNLPLRINQEEENVFGLRLAAGVEYKLNDKWSARTTFRYVKLEAGAMEWTDNVKELTFGLRYSF